MASENKDRHSELIDFVVTAIHQAVTATISNAPEPKDKHSELLAELAALTPTIIGANIYNTDALRRTMGRVPANQSLSEFFSHFSFYLERVFALGYGILASNIAEDSYGNSRNSDELGIFERELLESISPGSAFLAAYRSYSLTRALYWYSNTVEFSSISIPVFRLQSVGTQKPKAKNQAV